MYSTNKKVFNHILSYFSFSYFILSYVIGCQGFRQENPIITHNSDSFLDTNNPIKVTANNILSANTLRFPSTNNKKYIELLQQYFFDACLSWEEKNIPVSINHCKTVIEVASKNFISKYLENPSKKAKDSFDKRCVKNIKNYPSPKLWLYALRMDKVELIKVICTMLSSVNDANSARFNPRIDSIPGIIYASIYQNLNVLKFFLNNANVYDKTGIFTYMKYSRKDHLNLLTMALMSSRTDRDQANGKSLKYDTITCIIDAMADPKGPKCSIDFFKHTIHYLLAPKFYEVNLPTLELIEWLETPEVLDYFINVLKSYTPKSSMNRKWRDALKFDTSELYEIAKRQGKLDIICALEDFVLKFKNIPLSTEEKAEEEICSICHCKLYVDNQQLCSARCKHYLALSS